jgi:hypothetical protein
MTPKDPGQDPIELRLAEVADGVGFTDEATLGDTVVRTVHRVEALSAERVRVTYRTEITGPGGDKLGPMITHDFPEVLAALLAHAAAWR